MKRVSKRRTSTSRSVPKGKKRIIMGGWYQRTTLHLTEVYGFLKGARSKLDLSKEQLVDFQRSLHIKSVERVFGPFEHILMVSKDGVTVRYYEDGLYILEVDDTHFSTGSEKLRKYFNGRFSPAIEYIFSLGSPNPKALANINSDHPFVIYDVDRNPSTYKIPKEFGHVYSKYHSKGVSVYKTEHNIVVVSSPAYESAADNIIEMQIFFREFKDQLHKYLNIHRSVWQEIEEIKKEGAISGKQVSERRAKLEGYKKTILLIKSRINQMNTYAKTRSSFSKGLKIDSALSELFQYRFEDLFNTLAYIKDLWSMTVDYVNDSLNVVRDIEKKSNVSSLRSIQLLASIGVVSGIFGYISRSEIPSATWNGVFYISILGLIALVIHKILRYTLSRKKYRIDFSEREKKI